MRKTVLACALFQAAVSVNAASFAVVKLPDLPIEMIEGEEKTVKFVLKNLGKDIFLQDGAPILGRESTLTVESADSLLNSGSSIVSFPYDVDLTINGSNNENLTTHSDSNLYVTAVQVSKTTPLFAHGVDTEFLVTLKSASLTTVPESYHYTMYFRFYDARCSEKLAKAPEPKSKHPRCIVYSLPIASQNVRLLPRKVDEGNTTVYGMPVAPAIFPLKMPAPCSALSIYAEKRC